MSDGAAPTAGPPLILHAGCGGASLPEWFEGAQEFRVDIDPLAEPDLVASMTDLGEIGPFHAVYCCHSLEHLHPDDADLALREFRRVLSPGGWVFILVPDLEGIKPTDEVVYLSPSGPITGLDMIYGLRRATGAVPAMMHRTGFIASTLKAALERAGFTRVVAGNYGSWNLLGTGYK